MMKSPARFVTLAVSSTLFACASLTAPPVASKPKIKNVIMVIGDGMGPQQVGLLLSYARQAPHGILKNQATAFDRLMQQSQLSLSLTHAAHALTTDSAASATQLATGVEAGAEMIGLDARGDRQENIISKAKRLGKSVGLVSDTRITHATPAAFAAHEAHRNMENEIAVDLLNADPDVLLSAGLNYWLPERINSDSAAHTAQLKAFSGLQEPLLSARHDQLDLLASAGAKGYTLAFNREQLQQAQGKTIGLFANLEMANAISEQRQQLDPTHSEPSLTEMSAQALRLLQQNEHGFFLMIEAGQIDWAGHNNDTGLLLHEMLRINQTLNYVLDWLQDREDTLLIVTADHETGGFGFSYSSANVPEPYYLPGEEFADKRLFHPLANFGDPEILDRLYQQDLSYAELFKRFDGLPAAEQTAEQLVSMVNQHTQFPITIQQAQTLLTTQDNPHYIAGDKYLGLKKLPLMPVNGAFFPAHASNKANLLAQAVATQQQAVWSTGTHTSTPVYVFVQGPASILPEYRKILHHTELGQLAIKALTP